MNDDNASSKLFDQFMNATYSFRFIFGLFDYCHINLHGLFNAKAILVEKQWYEPIVKAIGGLISFQVY